MKLIYESSDSIYSFKRIWRSTKLYFKINGRLKIHDVSKCCDFNIYSCKTYNTDSILIELVSVNIS